MKHKYDKPSVEIIEVCQTDVLSSSGGIENFEKNWLPTLDE